MNTRLATGIQLSRRLRSELSNAASKSTGATNKTSARSGSSAIRGLLGSSATITPPKANSDGDGTLIRRASAASNTAPTSSDNVQSRILMRGPQPESNPASELLRSAGQRNPGRGARFSWRSIGLPTARPISATAILIAPGDLPSFAAAVAKTSDSTIMTAGIRIVLAAAASACGKSWPSRACARM